MLLQKVKLSPYSRQSKPSVALHYLRKIPEVANEDKATAKLNICAILSSQSK